jgi:cation:H+ antiporter
MFLIVQSRQQTQADVDEFAAEVPRDTKWDRHWSVQTLLVAGGLLLLVQGSDWLVTAAVAFARQLGVSDLVIGLTIVAAGTSMPEFATSAMAALKGERDIAVGNVVGSNTFNILGCLGLSGLVSADGLPMSQAVLNFDLWVMLAATFACLPVFLTGRQIARWEGGLFVGYYMAYTAYLFLASQRHALLPGFSEAMLSFVIPLTIVTLIVMLIRSRGSADHSR